MTLTDWLTSHSTETLFQGTKIDTATQQNIIDWFQFREVCDDDKFGVFFNRRIKALSNQYNQLLRIESVTFDPMVTQYLERQIKTNGSETGTGKDITSGEETFQNNGSNESSVTADGTNTANGNSSGSDNSTDNGENSNNSTTNTEGDAMQLNGVTPDSSLYPAGGFPAELAWAYASGQAQGKNTGKSTVQGSGTNKNTHTGSNSSEYENSGTSHSETVSEGSVNNSGTRDHSSTVDKSDSRTHEQEVKEISTGRGEAPQDLLERARGYIMNTNAFLWLISNMAITFYGIVE